MSDESRKEFEARAREIAISFGLFNFIYPNGGVLATNEKIVAVIIEGCIYGAQAATRKAMERESELRESENPNT